MNAGPPLPQRLNASAGTIQSELRSQLPAGSSLTPPLIGLILGTGQGEIAEQLLPSACTLPYGRIPNFPVPSVSGHAGKLYYGQFDNTKTPIVVLSGRSHTYEGLCCQEVAYNVMTLARWGVKILILTSAVGKINGQYKVGDLVIVNDHNSLLMDDDPFLGNHYPELGPPFYPSAETYDPQLQSLAGTTLAEMGLATHTGILGVVLRRRRFETGAEVKALEKFGCDLVGVSIVAEALAAKYLQARVLGICLVTNQAGITTTHQEVQDEVAGRSERLLKFYQRLLASIIANC